MREKRKLVIECEMEARWVPHFMAMLNYMEKLGNIGSSRKVAIYADGDGDFRPKFTCHQKYDDATPIRNNNGNVLFDAG